MPVNFFTNQQYENYGHYTTAPSPHDLDKYFHLDVPALVLLTLAKQLRIDSLEGVLTYSVGEQRWENAAEIGICYGYIDITEH